MDNNNKENASIQGAFEKAHDAGNQQNIEKNAEAKQKLEDIEKKQSQAMPKASVDHQENQMVKNKQASKQEPKSETVTPAEITDMVGFELIDAQYQKEIQAVQIKVTEKHNLENQKKTYLGDKEMQAKARAHDNEMLQKKIHSELETYKKRIETFHFGETGRDATLEKLRKEALAKENNKQQEQQKSKTATQNEKEQDKMLREHGVKNIYELSRKIIKQQEMKQKKGRKR